jgi:hypothetical protein
VTTHVLIYNEDVPSITATPDPIYILALLCSPSISHISSSAILCNDHTTWQKLCACPLSILDDKVASSRFVITILLPRRRKPHHLSASAWIAVIHKQHKHAYKLSPETKSFPLRTLLCTSRMSLTAAKNGSNQHCCIYSNESGNFSSCEML